MIDVTQDIHPLTTFRNNSVQLLRQLKTTQRPIILTVNGKPEAVLQDPAAYQRLIDIAAAAEEEIAIQQGVEDMRAGRTYSLNTVFEELRVRRAIPR